MARAVLQKRKVKKSPQISRKSSKTLEERHIGIEVVDWKSVPEDQMERAVYDTLRHYNYFYDYKEAIKWAAEWIKKNKSRQYLKEFRAAPEALVSTTVCGLCKMLLNGAVFSDERMNFIETKLDEQRRRGVAKMAEDKDTKVILTKSPAELVKEKTSDFIAEIEGVIDMFGSKTSVDWDNYSVYNELQKIGAPYNTAKAVVDYYTPLRDEIKELVEKKTEDLVEAYRLMSVRQRKQYLAIIQGIIDDAEKYMASKKAVRKTRVAKPKSAGAQVAKLKYLNESAEFKVTSVDPVNLVGASEVYLFNTKYRTLTRLVTSSSSGFEIKGTTLHNVDLQASEKKTLRKPDEQLATFTKCTQAKARKAFDEIKTKPGSVNGRINEAMIILKVYK